MSLKPTDTKVPAAGDLAAQDAQQTQGAQTQGAEQGQAVDQQALARQRMNEARAKATAEANAKMAEPHQKQAKKWGATGASLGAASAVAGLGAVIAKGIAAGALIGMGPIGWGILAGALAVGAAGAGIAASAKNAKAQKIMAPPGQQPDNSAMAQATVEGLGQAAGGASTIGGNVNDHKASQPNAPTPPKPTE